MALPAVHHLIYLSSAAQLLAQDELETLMVRSQNNNRKMGITGLLLYNDGNFLQALEGDKETVAALFSKISRDPRHRGISVLFDEEINQRDFPDWSMGLHARSYFPGKFFSLANIPHGNPAELAATCPLKVRAFMRTFL